MTAAQIIEPIVPEARQELRRTHDVGEANDDRPGHEPPFASRSLDPGPDGTLGAGGMWGCRASGSLDDEIAVR
jgi:hypothetical protein